MLRLFLFAFVLLAGCGKPAEPPPPPSQALRPAFARDDFEKRVIGKSPDEVMSAVGPATKMVDEKGGRAWYYPERTKGPGDKVDAEARVIFTGGKAAKVEY